MSSRSLSHDVLSIGSANAIDYALQFLIPVVIARTLSIEDFAGYRMVWLVVGTLMAFATLEIPQSLSYFLPRKQRNERPTYVVGAVYILTVLAFISAVLVNPWAPLLPVEWVQISGPVWFYSVFIFLWVIASLVEFLPISDGNAVWQAKAIITLAITRSLFISIVAWMTESLESVLYALLLFSVFKLVLLGIYIAQSKNWQRRFPNSIPEQLRYTWSFGIASGLFSIRRQAELWLVAALFSAKEFASFSLGAVGLALFGLVSASIKNVIFPKLSALEANKDKEGIAVLNKKATSAVAFLLVPAGVFLWVFADEIISLIYTSNYADAAGVMRVYLLGIIPMGLESSILLRMTKQGKVALKIDLFMLPVVIFLSYLGITLAGLPGGAAGSVSALFIGHIIAIRHGAAGLGIAVFDLYDFFYLGGVVAAAITAGVIAILFILTFGISGDIGTIFAGAFILFLSYLIIMLLAKKVPAPIVEIFRNNFY
jgi:O-antigen/teichoic acid export membrane protein